MNMELTKKTLKIFENRKGLSIDNKRKTSGPLGALWLGILIMADNEMVSVLLIIVVIVKYVNKLINFFV